MGMRPERVRTGAGAAARRLAAVALAVAAVAALPRGGEAQWVAEPRFEMAGGPRRAAPTSRITVSPVASASDAGLVVAGVAAAATGFVGGAYLGYQAERRWFWCSCDDPGLLGALVGAAVGPAVLTPFLVHDVNDRRGSLGQAYAAAAVIGGLGFTGLLATTSSPVGLVFLFGTPVVQALSAVSIEKRTAQEAGLAGER